MPNSVLSKPAVVRYHPVLVTLHWLLAFLILSALGVGFFLLDVIPSSAPQRFIFLRLHVICGALIGALTLVRLVVRSQTKHPQLTRTAPPQLARLAQAVHMALYAFVLLVVASGHFLSFQAGLPGVLFGGEGQLPKEFDHFLAHTIHGAFAALLLLSVALHAAAAFYHQLVLRDQLLSRMGYHGW